MATILEKEKKNVIKSKRLFIVKELSQCPIFNRIERVDRLVVACSEKEAIEKSLKFYRKKSTRRNNPIDVESWTATELRIIDGHRIILKSIPERDRNFEKDDYMKHLDGYNVFL